MTQPAPNTGSTWRSLHEPGLRVTVDTADDWSVRITELDSNGQPTGRGRWTTIAMLHSAYEQETP